MRLRRPFLVALSLGFCQCGAEDAPLQEVEMGAPCTPTLEKDPAFAGFRVTETTIEAGAPECGGGVCLVNHFQGRVSCPLGQPKPVDENGLVGCVPDTDGQGAPLDSQGSCGAGDVCKLAGSFSPACDPADAGADTQCQAQGVGSKCNAEGFCECATTSDCLAITVDGGAASCDPITRRCVKFACQGLTGCQEAGSASTANAGKACCGAGSDAPLVTSVCGQCRGPGEEATRTADSAVYCTCRCGVADGEPDEPDFDFCTCADGFECSQIRPYTGVGDKALTGKFCIKAGTAYDPDQDQCGFVDGYWSAGSGDMACAGAPSGECQSPDGPCED